MPQGKPLYIFMEEMFQQAILAVLLPPIEKQR